MPISITPRVANDRFVISQISTIYPTPIAGLKEYVSNSIDNVTQYGADFVNIGVQFDPDWRNRVTRTNEPRVIVIDNGTGIYWRKFVGLPTNFGNSPKRGRDDTIGRKGFGVWAYGAVDKYATYMNMYTRVPEDRTLPASSSDSALLTASVQQLTQTWGGRLVEKKSERPRSSKTYYVLRFPTNSRFERGDNPVADVIFGNQLEPRIEFDQGTMVVVNNIPKRSIPNIRATLLRDLPMIYDPLIRGDKVRIQVGRYGDSKQTILQPVNYTGDVLVELEREVPYVDDNDVTKPGRVVVYVVRSDKSPSPRVRLYNDGVFVRDLPGAGPEFNEDFWLSGNVSGYVATDSLDLKASRAEVQPDVNFRIFAEAMKDIKSDIENGLKRYHSVPRTRTIIDRLTDEFMAGLFEVLPGWERRYGLGSGTIQPGKLGDPLFQVETAGRGLEEETEESAPGKGRGKGGSGGRGGSGTPKDSNRNTKEDTDTEPRDPSLDIGDISGNGKGENTTRRGKPSYIESEDGEKRPGRRGRAIIPYIIERPPEGFPEEESYLKSKLVYVPGTGASPRIYINVKHPQRVELEKLGHEKVFRYDAELISIRASSAEILSLCSKFSQLDLASQLETMTAELATDFLLAGLRRSKIEL